MDAVRISEHWLERYRDDGDAALRDATTAVDASWGNHKAFDAARRALAAVTGALEEHVDNDARLLEGAKAQLDGAWAVIDVTSAATIDASWRGWRARCRACRSTARDLPRTACSHRA